jgi:hypothetical protein
VPWYKVTVDSGNHESIIKSEFSRSKDYVGTAVNTDFKFDHLIQGWDYSGGDGTVLINHGFFANLIPEKVEEWVSEQFMDDIKGGGKAEYEAFDPTQQDALGAVVTNASEEEDVNGDGIVDAKIVEKDMIRFSDNWQQVGELTWVSDVEVDGKNENVTYQVHGGQPFEDRDKDGNQLTGFIIQGGYIYPAGANIYHDPSLVAIALLFELVPGLNLLPGNIVGGQLLLALMATVVVGITVVVRKRKEKKNRPTEPSTGEWGATEYNRPPMHPPGA